MIYGFCIPPIIGNADDCVDIWVSIQSTAPFYREKEKAFHTFNIDNNHTSFKITETDPVPSKLLLCLRIMHATKANIAHLDSFAKFAPAIATEKQISHEKVVIDALMDTFKNMLEQYSSTIDEDVQLLQSWDLLIDSNMRISKIDSDGFGTSCPNSPMPSFNPTIEESPRSSQGNGNVFVFVNPEDRFKNAVILRYSEKRILTKAIMWLEQYKLMFEM